MPLENILVIRVNGNLDQQLQEIALKSGVSKSALIRNTLALCLLPPRKPSQVEAIMLKIRKEATDELYGRGKHNGEDQSVSEKEAIEKATKLREIMME